MSTTMTREEAPHYSLSLQDLQDYAIWGCSHQGTYVGVCSSACNCLGASALGWKYPGKHFQLPGDLNVYFLCIEEGDDALRHPLEDEVSLILCEFDNIMPYFENWKARTIDGWQLWTLAHDGEHPMLAQLFSSPSPGEEEVENGHAQC